ncbi:MAG: aminoacyl-tRNA hydrolase [Planctomycetes bacterium]|nr:aminoacyl-tRNA hydrolase [Planctomycetota bacterium]
MQRVRSGGPGGQNVNKTSSKIVLRFAPGASSAFDAEERARVVAKLAHRLNKEGELVLHANEERSAERNLDAARTRLARLLAEALVRPKLRRATRPTRAAGVRRLDAKRRRAEVKRGRRDGDADSDG